MTKQYFCLKCSKWVDKLYRYRSDDKEEIWDLLCQNCLLESSEEKIDSNLLHYSNSYKVINKYLEKLKSYKSLDQGINQKKYEDEIDYLETVVLPDIKERLKELKNKLM